MAEELERAHVGVKLDGYVGHMNADVLVADSGRAAG